VIIAHLSDTHLGERPQNAARLHQLARHIRARHDAGEQIACALTGDLTHDSQPSEWEALHKALEPLAGHVPLWLVPGNHDVGRLGITYDRVRADRVRAEIGVVADTTLRAARGMLVWQWGGAKIIGLDSTRGQEGELLPPLARGEIGLAQLAALEVELQEDVPTVVLLHHHPRWRDPGHVLEDASALLELLDRRAHVRAVLYGHRHVESLAQRGALGGHRTSYLGAGKATDLTAAGRLSYRTIEMETGRVQVVTFPSP
jgi:3',5'-cyclic AMP phosphodiesterase CpdA